MEEGPGGHERAWVRKQCGRKGANGNVYDMHEGLSAGMRCGRVRACAKAFVCKS